VPHDTAKAAKGGAAPGLVVVGQLVQVSLNRRGRAHPIDEVPLAWGERGA